jgi:cytochrome c biogenesis protein CcmG/thiol:disulfide interchange protein DsbE
MKDDRVNLKSLLVLGIGLLTGISLGALVLLSGPGWGDRADRRLPPVIGGPVKGIELTLTNGKTIEISSLSGKPVILNFWATWCPPCKEEMPLLEKYANRYPDELVIIGVNYVEDQDVVQRYIAGHNITFPIALDKTGNVSDLYFVRSFPMTFFVDKDGVLRAQHIGLLSDDVMKKYLELIGIP